MPLAVSSKVDLIFRAFSDRTRLRILNLLREEEEVCVCDIMRVLDLPQAKVSRHLAYLRKAGLVAGRKDQQWMYYRLQPGKGKFHVKILECLACCLGEVPELKEDRARMGSLPCNSGPSAKRCCD